MARYWLSFRLHDSDGWEKTYGDRLAALNAEIKAASGNGKNWWFETTSFFVFNSTETIGTLVTRVTRAIAVSVDLVVIGSNDAKTGRAIGNLQDRDILTLIPGMTKV
jgi:hypothetical protein